MSRLRRLGARLVTAVRRDPEPAIATVVAFAAIALLAATASVGVVRDEGYYFRAAREYHAWVEGLWRSLGAGDLAGPFSDATLRRAFGYNTEHPGLVKLLMGVTWKVFHVWLGASGILSFRLASIAIVGVGAAFTYLFGARAFGRVEGLLAVAVYFACPHVFYHAHLAAFDAPVAALGVAASYGFWRSLRSRPWVLGAGLLFGLALATKHNAAFVPPTLAVAWLLARRHELSLRGGVTLPAVPLGLVAMAILGPLVLYATYPYGWRAPFERLGAYYAYHLGHENYPVDYLGTLYRDPPFPWSFPFVMSGLTIPLSILCAGLAGTALLLSVGLGRERDARADAAWIVLLGVVVPPLVIALPTVPIFGGTKHWLPMMPFFAIAAAVAVAGAARTVASLSRRAGPALGVALAVAIPALGAAETARSHPLGHTWFNELALGHQGAAALGMPRGFWGGAGGSLLAELDARAAPGDTVFSHRMNRDAFDAYQADGLLRADLRWTGDLRRARWALVYHQREHQDVEYATWLAAGDRRPVASVAIDGVPIVSLYRLPDRPPGATAPFRPPPPPAARPAADAKAEEPPGAPSSGPR